MTTICQIGAFHQGTSRTPTNADFLHDHLQELGITSICASRHLGGFRRAMDMTLTLITARKRYSMVLIHVFSGKAFLWALLAVQISRILRNRIVLWLHGGDLPDYSRRHPRLVNVAFKHATRILAPSGYLRDAFCEKYDVNIMPVELPVKRYPFRQRKTALPRLLWVRAFNAFYNPSMAVKVIKILLTSFPDVKLTMCGPDNHDGSFQNTQLLAQELGVDDKIHFPGKVSKERIRELGQEHDIFINTTNYDNTPVSVIEAMAMGMGVVSTDVGGVSYLVRHGSNGLLVPPENPEAMAEACTRLLSDQQLMTHLSGNARQTALEYDWEVLAPKWQELISQHAQSEP